MILGSIYHHHHYYRHYGGYPYYGYGYRPYYSYGYHPYRHHSYYAPITVITAIVTVGTVGVDVRTPADGVRYSDFRTAGEYEEKTYVEQELDCSQLPERARGSHYGQGWRVCALLTFRDGSKGHQIYPRPRPIAPSGRVGMGSVEEIEIDFVGNSELPVPWPLDADAEVLSHTTPGVLRANARNEGSGRSTGSRAFTRSRNSFMAFLECWFQLPSAGPLKARGAHQLFLKRER